MSSRGLQLLKLNGGTVRADSPGLGQGATFTVQIPLAFQPVEIPLDQHLSSTTDLSGVQVLVVDDEQDSLDFITFVLEQANAKVTAVASGFDALQSIAYLVPDIIVSDIGMSSMDGYMLMRQIRQLPTPQGGNIPAIALTAYAGEIDRTQALAVGFHNTFLNQLTQLL